MDPEYRILCSYGQDRDTYEVYSALAQAGYDVNGMLDTSSMDRKAVKLIQKAVPSLQEDLTPKQLKKMKKPRLKKRSHSEVDADIANLIHLNYTEER